MEVENGYWVKKRYPYAEIVRLQGINRFGDRYFKVYTADNPERRAFELHPNMYKFGRMIENLVQRLPNLREFTRVDEIIAGKDADGGYWQKEPDWDIINAAIARAEENRRKQEQVGQV